MFTVVALATLFSFLSVVSFDAEAISSGVDLKVKESVTVPHGWEHHGTPSPDLLVKLHIALPQPNFFVLEKHLYEVSDPYHHRYGAHLSKEETEELVAPHDESIHAVDKWLSSHGIQESDFVRSPAKDWVILTIPMRLAEQLLNATYSIWKHTASGDQLVRTTRYSLPEDIFDHVELVQPTTTFGRYKREKSNIAWMEDAPVRAPQGLAPVIDPKTGLEVDPSCNSTITIRCLQQIFNIGNFTPTAKGNSIGITGYLEEFANKQDLRSFYEDQRPDAINTTYKFFSVNGGENSQNISEAGGEANLDVQFAFGLAFPIKGTFYSTGGRLKGFKPDLVTPTNTDEPYAEWLRFVLGRKDTPLVISTSYGDDEQTIPASYMRRVCGEFAQLGARGVSVLFASGDGGVGDGDENPATQICKTNDGKNTTRFLPSFPASCPFVTTVGGTAFIPEVAVSRFFSGGGFSDTFSRPQYQDKVVQSYLNDLPKGLYKGLFSPQGRAYPDVSAQSDRFRIFLSGRARLIGGTSASTPAFAGLVALLNDVRLSRGKSPLGFLNPLLYSKGVEGLNDITIGRNPGCGTPGFNATKGWDPVTGLGTPDFGKLRKLVV